jgi:hypothetical protein
MTRTTIRRMAGVFGLVALVGGLAGCTTHPPPPISTTDLQLARQFPLYTTYWVGRDFQGIALTAADSKRDYDAVVGMRAYYGTCAKPSSLLSTSGCKLPLEIATVLYHPHTNEGLGARREAVIRGVPAEIFNGGSSIELYTGHLAIDVYADGPARAIAAAEALRPLNRAGAALGNLAPARFDNETSKSPVDPRVKAIADRLRAQLAATSVRAAAAALAGSASSGPGPTAAGGSRSAVPAAPARG